MHEDTLGTCELRFVALEQTAADTKKDIKEIKERLLGRPSWAVCIVITLLSSITFASLTFAFTIVSEFMKH